jgi:IS30 family transposase
VESREGLDMTGHEMAFLAAEVKAGLEKGQSVHHIFASRDDLPCSERSFYRHVENEDIDVRKMDLRKKVKYKKRNKRKANRRERGFYAGREYSDYMELDADVRANTVQMDCVEGAEGDEQALLTLHFVTLRFQIYILLEKKDSGHVVAALDWLEGLCGGKGAFKKLFGLILADRGAEFDDIAGIEKGGRCSVYYTDPQRPDQKGACEKAHVELRKVIGKGASIDGLELEAWLVAGICSHVNSSMRLSIGDASPMALAKAALPASLLEGLGLELIPPDEVETRPELIGRLKQERDDNKQR